MLTHARPDLLRYGATLPVDTVDPLCGLWGEASSLVFSRPFAVDEHGALRADLVGEHATDGLRHWLRPRPGVLWHDGEPLTVDDLALSLRLVTDPQYRGAFKQHIGGVVDVQVDGDAVVVELERPQPGLLHALAKTCVVPAHRFTPERLAAGDLDREPVGTGPYRLVVRSSRVCRLSRHEAFHGGPGAIAEIDMIEVADDEERAGALVSGELDLAQIKAQHVAWVSGTPGLRVHPIQTRVWRALTFNLSHPLLRDPAVRRGLSQLIDREEIVARALGGHGRPQFYPAPPSSWASPPAPPVTGRDVGFATLRSAGCERNVEGVWSRDGAELALTLAYLRTETFRAVASEVIAEQLTRCGVPVSLVPITWEQYRAMDSTGLRGSEFDGIVVGWSGGVDPYENLAVRYSSTGAYNRDGYHDDEVDALLDQAVASADRKHATALYHRVLEITHRDSIMAPLVNPEYLFAARDDLTGFEDFEVDSFYEFPQYAHRIRHTAPR
ncbi:ABC transporter substrate-binding protein [Georgenia faecalis]|uniref:ABC transporter substrate-binding protein n=1 Tax=Georgenia faecalis TaxID=2483799 RepID=A0ABV9DA39_9MICO|nr:ABC transporter substrate-binding protein [Georgenia faecalis]